MFRPELKNTGWGTAPEVVFEITGEDYRDLKWGELESVGTIERDISLAINNELMNMVWESITVKEMEEAFKEAMSNIDTLSFRLDFRETFDTEPGPIRFDLEDCVYGWVHFKENKKTKTFRFKINLRGKFSIC